MNYENGLCESLKLLFLFVLRLFYRIGYFLPAFSMRSDKFEFNFFERFSLKVIGIFELTTHNERSVIDDVKKKRPLLIISPGWTILDSPTKYFTSNDVLSRVLFCVVFVGMLHEIFVAISEEKTNETMFMRRMGI